MENIQTNNDVPEVLKVRLGNLRNIQRNLLLFVILLDFTTI